jgi:hypothetical protein
MERDSPCPSVLHFVLRLSVEGKGFPSILRSSGSKDTLKGTKGVRFGVFTFRRTFLLTEDIIMTIWDDG